MSIIKIVWPNLWVANDEDREELLLRGDTTSLVWAAKDPYHRKILGYTTKGAPKDDPEYLYAERGNDLYLNLVDAPDIKYISEELMDHALMFIDIKRRRGNKVIIICNKGESRAPGIAFLYLAKFGYLHGDYEEMKKQFLKIYPYFNPGKGIEDYLKLHT